MEFTFALFIILSSVLTAGIVLFSRKPQIKQVVAKCPNRDISKSGSEYF